MQKYSTQKVITAVLLLSLIGSCYASEAPAGENVLPVASARRVEVAVDSKGEGDDYTDTNSSSVVSASCLSCPVTSCLYHNKTRPMAEVLHHFASQHGSKDELPYVCDICSNTFASSSAVISHIHRRHAELSVDRGMWHCDKQKWEALKLRVRTFDVDDSGQTVPKENNVCRLCTKGFNNHRALRDHHASKHTPNLKPYYCQAPECGQVFASRIAVRQHAMRKHKWKKGQNRIWTCNQDCVRRLDWLIGEGAHRVSGQPEATQRRSASERVSDPRPSKRSKLAAIASASKSSVSIPSVTHFACTKCEMKCASEQEIRDHASAIHRYRSKSSTQYWKRTAPLPLPTPQAEVPARQEMVSEQTNQQLIDCLFCQKKIINSTRVQHIKTECLHLVPCLMRAVQNDHPELFPLLIQGLQQNLRSLYPAGCRQL